MKNELRVARARRRVSQLTTARQAGLEVTRYWRIENSVIEPTAEERRTIAAALGFPEPELWPSPPASDRSASRVGETVSA
jgi:transcriptional regulator with XRE-family HTH domain